MPPKEKCILVESLYSAVKGAGLFNFENEDNLEGRELKINFSLPNIGCDIFNIENVK